MEKETNIIEDMLSKGDNLKPRYKDFDFNSLADTQISMINHLTFFSKYKHKIMKHFEAKKISREVKIMFLD